MIPKVIAIDNMNMTFKEVIIQILDLNFKVSMIANCGIALYTLLQLQK